MVVTRSISTIVPVNEINYKNRNSSIYQNTSGVTSIWTTTFAGQQDIQRNAFKKYSLSLMYYVPHKTKLLNIAQSYIGRIVEVTPDEYAKMSEKDRLKTQMAFIGTYGTPDEAWCAHTVSYMCEQAGINIGAHKKGVAQFIQWGKEKGIYNPISTVQMCSVNYLQERQQRAMQIRSQIAKMQEGDLVIWKSDTCINTQKGLINAKASHIGIFECINPDGSISVLEGNANETKTGFFEKYIATKEKEAKNGNQKIGEAQEINPRDGFIRKTYTPEQLAASGYSGYINMQSLVK